MANMLSRARFNEEEGMVSEYEDVEVDFFESSRLSANKWSTPTLHLFNEDDYEGEWLVIGRVLSMMAPDATSSKDEASRVRKKAYWFFLRNGKIWRHPKKRTDAPLWVVARRNNRHSCRNSMTAPSPGIEERGPPLRS